MKIAFDVMGSDNGIKNPITAALKIVNDFDDVEIILVGDKQDIESEFKAINPKALWPQQITIYQAKDVIPMHAGAIEGIRMPDSSMSQAVQLVKKQEAHGILTSGSTASYLGICHFLLGEIVGIKRPAFMPIMPTLIKDQQVVILDVGANIENTSDELIAFALMADIYCKNVKNIAKPKIALLNIGIESKKGPKVTKEAYAKLKTMTLPGQPLEFLNFIGNIEARDVLSGNVDIVVCDGYSGNIFLKSVEGMATILFTLIRQEFKKNIFRKLSGVLSLSAFKGVRTTFDYKNTGGAQLIGINGICFKAHGSSDDQAYYSTLKLLRTAILQDVTKKMQEQIALAPVGKGDIDGNN